MNPKFLKWLHRFAGRLHTWTTSKQMTHWDEVETRRAGEQERAATAEGPEAHEKWRRDEGAFLKTRLDRRDDIDQAD